MRCDSWSHSVCIDEYGLLSAYYILFENPALSECVKGLCLSQIDELELVSFPDYVSNVIITIHDVCALHNTNPVSVIPTKWQRFQLLF